MLRHHLNFSAQIKFYNMKNNLFLLIFCLTTLHGFSQTTYSAKFKIVSTKNANDAKGKIEDLFLDSMLLVFYASDSLCFLKETKMEAQPGINANQTGDENVYINYKDNSVYFKLDSKEVFTFNKHKFEKKTSNLKILGMKTTKYVSEDGNIIIYTSKELPWYVQPCLITSNQFNESIVKFENHKTNSGLELTNIQKIKSDKDYEDVYKKILRKKGKNKKSIECPFLR